MLHVILVCIVILILSAITAKKFESIANMKGHSGYFWWCFWLGVIGWAMVIALPDRKMEIPGLTAMLSEKAPNVYNTEQEADDSLPEL